jgi:hypothetical protein
MIIEKIGYSYNDLTIVPSEISNVSSRSECNPYIDDSNNLPIFTAPMASVINENNIDTFIKNGIIPIIPRNISLEKRKQFMHEKYWVALSLKEFENLFVSFSDKSKTYTNNTFNICVDIANGHMKSLYDKCIKAKELSDSFGYTLNIMTGNIANAKTLAWICQNAIYKTKENKIKCAIDYIRIGIGGGSGCFTDGTQIRTINGNKNIEDINIGDKVLTIDGSYQNVIDKTRFKSNELIKINNEIVSTINHKYFVINKQDKENINEQNLQEYGYWIEANKLNKEKHLLIKYE